jgi:Uma2 family endonuclease
MSTAHLSSIEDLLALSAKHLGKLELWEGELIEVPPAGGESAGITFMLGGLLFTYARDRHLGYFTSAEGGFILSRDPTTVVAPDIGFVRADRLPDGLPKSLIDGRPDLAIEVISSTDTRADIENKQQLYAQAGVPLVWWVDPEARTVAVHRLDQPLQVLGESDTLDGGEVLPGFQLEVRRIFEV